MRRPDHILAFTTTLLRSSSVAFPSLLTTTQKTYTLDSPRKPNAVSLGATEDGHEETLTTWLNRLRAEDIKQVTVSYQPFDTRDDMPPHVAVAFIGTPDLLLQVATARKTHTYTIDTYFASQYELTAAQFITLLDSQQDKNLVWSRATEMILESNAMNNRSTFQPEETAAYLQTDEGQQVFDYLSGDLVKEIQIECTVHENIFIIPATFQPLFVKYEDSFGFNDDEHADLSEAFDLDEVEQKRAAARSKNKDRWMLQSNQNPWEHYTFRAIDFPHTEEPVSPKETQAAFVQALENIRQFAATIQSPFEEAFAVSLFLLRAPIPVTYSTTHTETLASAMLQAGISTVATDNFRQATWVSDLGTSLGWDPNRIHSLLALKFADVFGGMGSWNDQYIEEADQEKFHQVSSSLFESLKYHLAATLA